MKTPWKVLFATLLLATPAAAQTTFWTGTSGFANWNVVSNWTNGVPGSGVPSANGTAVFSNSGGLTNPNLLFTSTNPLDGILFTGGASAYTFNDGTLLLNDGALVRIGNTAGTNTQTINMGTQFNGSGTLQNDVAAATLNMGSVSTNGGGTLSVNGSGSINISGVVSGGGLTKNSAGTLTLSDFNNTYTGPTTINGGVLSVSTIRDSGVNSSIGAGSSVVIDGGTLRYTEPTTNAPTNRSMTLNAGGGTIDVVTLGRYVDWEGSISGAGGLTKTGAGLLILSATNSYGGVTHVAGGALLVNSLGAVATSAYIVDGGTNLSFSGFNVGNQTIGSLAGAGTVVGGTTTGGSNTVTMGGDGTSTTFSGAINRRALDPFGIIKVGGGTMSLTGTNSNYHGGTTINGGTLSIQSIADGGTNSSIGSGSHIHFGGGTLQYANTTTDGSTNRTVMVNGGDGTFDVATAGRTLTLSGVVAGDGRLKKSGPGTLLLTGNNSYGGGTTIHSGTLQIGDGGNNGSIDGDSGDIVNDGTLAVNLTSSLALNRQITGSGGVQHLGPGTLTLGYALSSYQGPTIVNNGTLRVRLLANGGSNSAIGRSSDAASNLVINGGRIQIFGDNADTRRSFTLGPDGGTLDAGSLLFFIGQTHVPLEFTTPDTSSTLTLNSTAFNSSSVNTRLVDNGSGKLNITKTGSGSWALQGNNNTFSGTVNVQGGLLSLHDPSSAGSNAAYVVSPGATLDVQILYGPSTAIGSLAGGGTVSIFADKTLDVGGDNTDTTFSGVIHNSGALKKTGTGTLTLSGTNTYTGATTINDGTLRVNGSLAAASAVTVNSGGALGGTGVVNGTVIVNDGGAVAPGASIGMLTAGSTTFNGGGEFAFEYQATNLAPVAGVDNDLLQGLTGASLSLADLSSVNRFNLMVSTEGSGMSPLQTYRFAEFDTITGAAAGDVSELFNVIGNFSDAPVVTLTQAPSGADYLTVSFAAVPEPSASVMLILAAVCSLAMAGRSVR